MLQTVVADVTPQEETADVSETTAACGSSFSCAAAAAAETALAEMEMTAACGSSFSCAAAAALAADTMTAAANHG